MTTETLLTDEEIVTIGRQARAIESAILSAREVIDHARRIEGDGE